MPHTVTWMTGYIDDVYDDIPPHAEGHLELLTEAAPSDTSNYPTSFPEPKELLQIDLYRRASSALAWVKYQNGSEKFSLESIGITPFLQEKTRAWLKEKKKWIPEIQEVIADIDNTLGIKPVTEILDYEPAEEAVIDFWNTRGKTLLNFINQQYAHFIKKDDDNHQFGKGMVFVPSFQQSKVNGNELHVSVPDVSCFLEEGKVSVSPERFMRLFGFFVNGVLLQSDLSQTEDTPANRASELTRHSQAATASFYELQCIEDLNKSKATIERIGLIDYWPHFFDRARCSILLDNFYSVLESYASMMALTGHVPIAPELTGRVGIAPYSNPLEGVGEEYIDYNKIVSKAKETPRSLIKNMNIGPVLAWEALNFAQQKHVTYDRDRDRLDKAFLQGFWTSQGFLDNVAYHVSQELRTHPPSTVEIRAVEKRERYLDHIDFI